MKTKKPQPVKQVYAETYHKGENPLNFDVLKELLENNRIEGYITKAGSLSDGNSFCDVHLTIKEKTK